MLPSVARELFTEHSDRLGRVIPAVSTCYYLVAQNRFGLTRLKLRFTPLEFSGKKRNMSFGIRINIATAAVEDIYERLCWVYTTLKNTLLFDHKGEAHNLFYRSELSKGKIPYPEQFSKKPNYEQDSLIRDLQRKDILCTRTDWINLGRDQSNQEICRYFHGRHAAPRSSAQSQIPYKEGSGVPTLSAGAQQSSYR